MKTRLNICKTFIQKYSHAWVFLYGLIYLPWFYWLEQNVTSNFYVIHSPLDDYIPFMEIFIVPYLLWFLYVAITCLYFFFADKHAFYKFVTLSVIGMTLFLIICTVFPNGLQLRPTVLAHDNIFTDLVKAVWIADTPTNVLPSLHVYNSVACYIAISHYDKLAQNKWIKYGSLLLTISIVLSTMFLKQHSVIDVIAALIMNYFVYGIVYVPTKAKQKTLAHQTI